MSESSLDLRCSALYGQVYSGNAEYGEKEGKQMNFDSALSLAQQELKVKLPGVETFFRTSHDMYSGEKLPQLCVIMDKFHPEVPAVLDAVDERFSEYFTVVQLFTKVGA